MKNSFQIAFVYIGLVIGAGFASGREIMQYFNFRSNTDFSGIILAAFLFVLIAWLILRRAHRLQVFDYDDYVRAVAPRGGRVLMLFTLLYMFCGFFVMLSGSGALSAEVLHTPKLFGILFMAVLCFLVFAFDIKGIVFVNSILVPFMLLGILYICISSIFFAESPAFHLYFLDDIKNNILVSAVCYVSYNTITAGAVLVPLARQADQRSLLRGAWIGGMTLGVLIVIIWIANGLYFGSLWYSEIPMFKLAELHGSAAKWIYSAVLLMSICTTAISQGFGILSYFRAQTLRQRLLCAAVLCIAALPFAMLGFSSLVDHLYGVFGFLGLLWLLWILIDAIRSR